MGISVSRLLRCAIFSAVLGAGLARGATQIDRVEFGLAMEKGDLVAARTWLDAGLPPDFMADRIGSGLMIAAWENNIPMMDLFLSRGAHLDATNKYGEQALQLAAFKGHKEAVQWLLERGAPVNRGDKQWSALHYASFNGNREIVQMLLSKGADVNARVPNLSTPLMLSAREGHADIAQDLIKAGADPRMKNDWGDTALSWAMRYEHYDIGKLVSSPEAFANAARIAPEERGKPTRSVAAPDAIEKLLRQIRIAEANGRPAVALRKQLANEVMRLRERQRQAEAAKQQAEPPTRLVITAKRRSAATQGEPEERVELQYGKKPAAPRESGAKASPDVAGILARMRAAQAKGEPTDELRQQLFDAVGYGGK